MRWADSDSSDEEAAYEPPPPKEEEPIEPIGPSEEPLPPTPKHANVRQPPMNRQRRGGQNQYNDNRGNRGYDKNIYDKNSNYNNNSRGGGGRQKQQQQQQQQQQNRGRDWKHMAKEQSVIGTGPVDGSGWMAKRRAKQELEEKEFRAKQEQLEQQKVQEKKEKRQIQLSALASALNEMKDSDKMPSSPPQQPRSGLFGQNIPKQQPPTKILARDGPGKQNKEKSEKFQKRGAKPPTYNYTIGQSDNKPKGELQPNGTVRFSRKDNSNKKEKDNETANSQNATPEVTGHHVVEFHDSFQREDDDKSLTSLTSKGSRASRNSKGSKTSKGSQRSHNKKNRNRRWGGRGDTRGGGRGTGARGRGTRGKGSSEEISEDGSKAGGKNHDNRNKHSNHRGGKGRGRGRGGGRGRGRGRKGSRNHSYEIGKD